MAIIETRKTAPRGGHLLLQIVLGALIGTVIFTVIGLLIPRTYTATASLLFPGAHSSASTGVDSSSNTAADSGGGGGADQPSLPLMQGVLSVPQPGTSPSTAYLILTSRKVSLELIDEFHLADSWGMSRQRTIEHFKEHFICTVGNSGDLYITFQDYNRARAIAVTTSAIDKLKKSVKELSLDPAGRNAEVLKDTLQQAQDDCTKDQVLLIGFQRAVGGTPPDTQMQVLGQTYGAIQTSLISADADANSAVANLRASTTIGENMLHKAMDPTNTGNALITTLYRAVVDRESDLALLQQRYTDKHPDVVKAKLALDVAKQALHDEETRQLTSLHNGASPYVKDATVAAISATAKAEGLRKGAASIRKQLDALTAAQVRYGELTMQLRDDRTRLTLVRSEYVKAQLIEQSRGPQFVLLDAPDSPMKANEFELYYFTLFGFALGIILVGAKALYTLMRVGMKNMGF